MMRLAAEKWNRSMEEISELFVHYDVLPYIEECFGIFHVEGDEAVLEDITIYLINKGGISHAETGK